MSLPEPLDILPALLSGLWVTIQLTAGGIALMLVLSFAAGLGKLSHRKPLRWLSIAYIEVFRGTSALVQLFWFFFVLPQFGLSIPPLLTGILVLGLNLGSYGAEVVRGSIQAIPKEQHEAAIACNFTPIQRLWRVLIPQAIPAMLPPFGNLFIELMKNTALVFFIGLSDLSYAGQSIVFDTGRDTDVYTQLLVIYFLLALIITGCVKALEHFAAQMMGRKATS